jgi:hypothetical protein
VVFFLVREVGGLLERGEGLEVEVGVDRFGSGGVDGLDGADGGLVVVALGEFGELWEGEAVDLADEDGGHRGIEEVFEELFGERGRRKTPSVATRHLPRKPGGGEVVGGLWCVCLRLIVHGAPLVECGWGLREL